MNNLNSVFLFFFRSNNEVLTALRGLLPFYHSHIVGEMKINSNIPSAAKELSLIDGNVDDNWFFEQVNEFTLQLYTYIETGYVFRK